MDITKRIARDRLGIKKDAELADFFGITPGAVSQWGDDDALPELRQTQLLLRRPTEFADFAVAKNKARAA